MNVGIDQELCFKIVVPSYAEEQYIFDILLLNSLR